MAQITQIKLHEDYDPVTTANDIAVAKLGGHFSHLEKAKLPKRSSKVSDSTTSYGYRLNKTRVFSYEQQAQEWKMVQSGRRDNKLRRFTTKTINTNQCNQELNAIGHRSINDNELCIKVNRNNNLCSGDIGGPTFINGKLVGIASRVHSEIQNNTYRKCDGKGPLLSLTLKLSEVGLNGSFDHPSS